MIGNAPMDQAAWLAIFMVGVRAGTKALFQWLASGKVGEALGARF
jgi:hypothetical protein